VGDALHFGVVPSLVSGLQAAQRAAIWSVPERFILESKQFNDSCSSLAGSRDRWWSAFFPEAMATIIEALDAHASQAWNKDWQTPAWKQFLLTGDTKLLKSLPKLKPNDGLPLALIEALPLPGEMDVAGRRFLQACLAANLDTALASWLQKCAPDETAQTARFADACRIAEEIGWSRHVLAMQVLESVRPLRQMAGEPTPAGNFLLSLNDPMLYKLAAEVCRQKAFRIGIDVAVCGTRAGAMGPMAGPPSPGAGYRRFAILHLDHTVGSRSEAIHRAGGAGVRYH